MNNAWSIVLRLPCRGLNPQTNSGWLGSCRIGASCQAPSRTAIVHERHQLLKRSFSATSWQLAKRQNPQRREVTRSPLASKSKSSSPPRPSQLKAAKEEEPEPAKKPEKAQVQLSEAQVADIVGPGLTFDQGMDLLQEIQYRRVTGSLSDKGLEFPDRTEFNESHRNRALEWLRDNYAVDERKAADEYAEELAERERQELKERAQRLRLYKKDDDAETSEDKQEEEVYVDEDYDKTPLKEDQTHDITSGSALAARKEYVEASRKKAKIEAEKVAEEMEARGEKPPEPYKGHDIVVAKQTALEQKREDKHKHWEKLAKEAELDADQVQADRSAFSRLFAPVAFGLLVIYGSWVYAESYEPPKSSMRVFPSISPANATVAVIAGINLLVFVMWRHPYAWKMMNRNFLLSPGVPRAFAVVGASFSHQGFNHLVLNMVTLSLVGSLIHQEVGRGNFLSLFLTSGTTGYLATLCFSVLSKSYLSATLGASAGVFGLVGAYFTLSPTRTISLPGFLGGKVEFESFIPLVVMVLFEVLRWRANLGIVSGVQGSGTDHMSHLGGLIAGALYGYIIRRRLEDERKEDDEIVGQSTSPGIVPMSTTVLESPAPAETSQ